MSPGAGHEKKRVSSERRKERSRDAARCRRGKETEVFHQLALQLPLPHRLSSTLDKASVMRLALSYLRLREALGVGETEMIGEESELDSQWTASCLKVLDGFLMVLSHDGDMVYTSDGVSRCLGLPQIDLLGQSIFDFTHPCDHEEIREILVHRTGSCKRAKEEQQTERRFSLRMKCTLASRGRTVNIKSATWKVLDCSGHVRAEPWFGGRSRTQEGGRACPSYLVLICEPIPHPANIEVPLDSRTFLSRHSLDMRFTYCDDRITELLGYDSEDLLEHSVYEYYHALDSDSLTKTHRNLFVKGQACTGQYRMLVKTGGYVWVETQATVIYNSKHSQPQCVVCVNYILSGVEEPNLLLSLCQSGTPSIKQEVEEGEGGSVRGEEEYSPSQVALQRRERSEQKEERAGGESRSQAAVLQTSLKGETEGFAQVVPVEGGALIALDFSNADTKVDAPLYTDVMLPSTSVLSPLSPHTEALSGPETTSANLEGFLFPSSSAPNSYGVPQGSTCSSAQSVHTLQSHLPGTPHLDIQFKAPVTDGVLPEDIELKPLLDTQTAEDLALEMLAPYISMDDDYQLRAGSPTQSSHASPVGAASDTPPSDTPPSDTPPSDKPLLDTPLLDTPLSDQPRQGCPDSALADTCGLTAPHGQDSGVPHGQDSGVPHGQDSGVPHGQDSGVPHGQDAGVPHGQEEHIEKQLGGHVSSVRPPSQKTCKRRLETISLSQAMGLGSVLQVVTDLPRTGKKVRRSEVGEVEAPLCSSMPESLTILLLPSDVVHQLLGRASGGGALPVPLPHLTRYDCEVNAPVAGRQGLLQGEELVHALDQSI
ncbi:hypoxia inducible factor 1 subunit alpha a [Brachyhypopomus gauderio]|uniref:hypoxia inducible factor 1 subunit alpha a n=1 Tax=Brachyhypopomus gauderio TaxID=698409 RepID=UPI0040417743